MPSWPARSRWFSSIYEDEQPNVAPPEAEVAFAREGAKVALTYRSDLDAADRSRPTSRLPRVRGSASASIALSPR
jgi:hypothetical protein